MITNVAVDGDGIVLRDQAEPLVSVFGKVMRPGLDETTRLPWEEILTVVTYVWHVPPDGERHVEMEINLVYGHYVSVPETASGFHDAVTRIAQFGTGADPDLTTLTEEGRELFRMPTSLRTTL